MPAKKSLPLTRIASRRTSYPAAGKGRAGAAQVSPVRAPKPRVIEPSSNVTFPAPKKSDSLHCVRGRHSADWAAAKPASKTPNMSFTTYNIRHESPALGGSGYVSRRLGLGAIGSWNVDRAGHGPVRGGCAGRDGRGDEPGDRGEVHVDDDGERYLPDRTTAAGRL